jgi:rhodanese-related sulfurtransferase
VQILSGINNTAIPFPKKKKMKKIFFLPLFLMAIFQSGAMGYTVISADSLYSWISMASKPFLLDVRETYEYNPKHIKGSVLYPWNSGVLQKRYTELPSATPIVVICASGFRSAQAAAFMDTVNAGRFYGFIYQLTGGLSSWKFEVVDSTAELPSISVNSTIVSFGETYLDSSSGKAFTIYNHGGALLTVKSISPGDRDIFQVTPDSAKIAQGDSLAVEITFTPRAAVSYSDSILITSDGLGTPRLTISVTGTGITAIAVVPGDVDRNGKRDIFDLLELLRNLTSASPSKKADVNSDGKVDIFDLLALLRLLSA